MEIEILKPSGEFGEHTYAALLVNDTYVIELVWTIMGSIQVTCRKKDDFGLMCRWCAGNEGFHVLMLVNCLLGFIEAGDEKKMPFFSDPKPYYKDAEFVARILPYAMPSKYFKKLEELKAAETARQVSDYEEWLKG